MVEQEKDVIRALSRCEEVETEGEVGGDEAVRDFAGEWVGDSGGLDKSDSEGSLSLAKMDLVGL